MVTGSDVTALTRKGDSRNVVYSLKTSVCTALALVTVRKCKVPDISTFYIQLTLYCVCCGADGSCCKIPAISLNAGRMIPAVALEMSSTTDAKQRGPVLI